MIKSLVTALLLFPLVLSAEMEIKNSKDRAIFEEAYSLASKILSQNGKSRSGALILKFASWIKPDHKGVKDMKAKAVFGDAITSHGSGSALRLCNMLMNRQKELTDLSAKTLYVLTAQTANPTSQVAVGAFKTMKDSGYETDFDNLIKKAKAPEMADLKAQAAKKAELEKKIEIENAKQIKSYSQSAEDSNRLKMPAAKIEELIDLIKFKTFSYSEASVLDAINRLTHKLYWRGVQVTVQGNRISYTDAVKAANGALFYVSPLYQPNSEEFTLTDVTLKDIFNHFNMNVNLVYQIEDGLIALSDSEIPEFSDIPEEGLAANNLRDTMRNFSIRDFQKYRSKSFKMNGIVTGIGRGMDRGELFLALDGGMIRLSVNLTQLNQDVYKRLDKKVDDWRKSGGLKKYRDKEREAEKSGEKINRETMVDKEMYITFKATCVGMDKDRLSFAQPEYISIDAIGEFLLEPKAKKK